MHMRLTPISVFALIAALFVSLSAKPSASMPAQQAIPKAAPAPASAPGTVPDARAKSALAASAIEPQRLALAGQVGGATKALAIQHQYAYVGIGPRLVIVDISTPAQPTKLGQTRILPQIVDGVAVAGDYAYVIAGDLYIFNLANPALPVEVGYYDMPSQAYGVAAAGKYVYVTEWESYGFGAGSGDMHILDVSNAAAPTKVGQFDGAWAAPGLAVAGNYAYVIVKSGLSIVNISDPAAPSQIGFFDSPSSYDVTVAGNYAYLTAGSTGTGDPLQIIDISAPNNPTQAGFANGFSAARVAISGKYAFLTGGGVSDIELFILDITDLAKPKQVGSYSTDAADAIAVSGSYAFIGSDRMGGLHSISVADPTAPSEVGAYTASGYAGKMAVKGNYAYVATAYDGVHIIDITDAANTSDIGHIAGKSLAIAVDLHYAYIASDNDGVRIFNITNPATPILVNTIPGIADDITAGGSRAFILSDSGITRVFDISDPTQPLEIGNLPVSADSKKLIKGNTLYVLDGSNGLRIFNAGTPGLPSEVGSVPIAANDIAVIGTYAYLASSSDGLHIINIADPTSPTQVNSLPYDVGVVAGDEHYLYAIKGSDRSQYIAYDISVPTLPTQVDTYSGFSLTMALAGSNDRMFVTDSYNGFSILGITSALSGRVATPGNNPLVGVTVSISSGESKITDAMGYYTFTGLLSGTYTLTPHLNGYTFAPPVSPPIGVPPSEVAPDFIGSLSQSACPVNTWTANYYANSDLQGAPSLTRCDQKIDFYWGTQSPEGSIPVDNFSVRWERTVSFPKTGTYRFRAFTDDGLSLYIDGQHVIDNWATRSFDERSTLKQLDAGNHQIVMEYAERTGDAMAYLNWYLCPTGAGDCSLNIIPMYQTNYLTNPMPSICKNTTNQTIASYGCLLTTLSMLLQHYGISVSPIDLNNWLSAKDPITGKQPRGYTDSCTGWLSAMSLIELYAKETGNINLQWQSTNDPISIIRDEKLPIILQVASGGHFVLATDVAEVNGVQALGINDPYHSFACDTQAADPALPPSSRLNCRIGALRHATQTIEEAEYRGDFQAWGYLKPLDTPRTPSLQFNTQNVEIMLADAQGRRVGYTSPSGQILTEIPSSFYYDAQILPAGVPSDGSVFRTLYLPEQAGGIYTLQVINKSAAAIASAHEFAIDVVGFDGQFNETSTTITGAIPSGQSATYTVDFNPGNTISLRQVSQISIYIPIVHK